MILVSEPFLIVTERCRYAWKGSRWIRNPLLSSFGIKWGWSSAAFGDGAAREVWFGVNRVCAVDLWWQNCVTLSPRLFSILFWAGFVSLECYWNHSVCRNYVVITLVSIDPPFSICLEVPLQVDPHLGDLAYKWGVMCVAPTMICHSLTRHPSPHSTLLMWCVLVTHLNEQSRNAWVSHIIDIVLLKHCRWPCLIQRMCWNLVGQLNTPVTLTSTYWEHRYQFPFNTSEQSS